MTAKAAAPPARNLPRSLLLTGAAGSLLVTVGGLGRGALPRPSPGSWLGISLLAETPTARTGCLVLALVGGLLLGFAWWHTRTLLEAVAPGALNRAAALWSVPLLVGAPLLSRDVYAYGAQAVVSLRGFDPYVLGPIEGGGAFSADVDQVWRGTPSPYGPAFLAPAALLVRLTGSDVVVSVLLLRLLAVVGLVLIAWALPRLAASAGVPAQRALWLGLANPLVLLHGVAGAHNDLLMVGLMLTGLAVGLGAGSPTRRVGALRLVGAGALVVLGALVKAPALAALPVLVLMAPTWRDRLRTGALVSAGGAAVAAVLPVATGLGWGWVGTVDTGRTVLSLFSPMTGLGTLLGSGARLLGVVDDTAAVRDPVLTAGTALGALAAVALLLWTRRLGPAKALGLAMLAVVLLSPTVLPWYVLWAVVPLAAAVDRRTAVALGAACLVLCFATDLNGRSVVRPPLFGLPMLAAAVVGVGAARREPAVPVRLRE